MTVSGLGPKAGQKEPPVSSQEVIDPGSSRPGYNAEGHKTAQAMREEHQSWADDQHTTTTCFFCDWTYVGSAGDGRLEALAHRQVEHPDACIRKPRPRGSRITKRRLRSAGQEEQIKVDAAESNRIRAEREQDEMLAKIERGRARALALDGNVV